MFRVNMKQRELYLSSTEQVAQFLRLVEVDNVNRCDPTLGADKSNDELIDITV